MEKPFRIGLVGCGEMGTDLMAHFRRIRGMDLVAVCDRSPQKALSSVTQIYGEDDRARMVSRPEALSEAITGNQVAVCPEAGLLVAHDLIDLVIDASGRPSAGAEVGFAALEHGKHVVMMNVEADVTVGALLKREADRRGVIYTLGAGDEPVACAELIDFVRGMGLPVVAAGKGKNNRLDPDAVPSDHVPEGQARSINPRTLVEFIDGTKTMVEMTALANGTGLIPDRPGMHGPCAPREALSSTFCLSCDGGLLGGMGRVDYTTGPGVAPGVFVVTRIDDRRIAARLCDLKMGSGPYFVFVRPYHLTALEVPLSCGRALVHGQGDLAPRGAPVAETVGIAKRALPVGEKLESIGETSYRGWIMTVQEARTAEALPLGLLEGARVRRPIARGEIIRHSQVELDGESPLVRLRSQQDALFSAPPEEAHGKRKASL